MAKHVSLPQQTRPRPTGLTGFHPAYTPLPRRRWEFGPSQIGQYRFPAHDRVVDVRDKGRETSKIIRGRRMAPTSTGDPPDVLGLTWTDTIQSNRHSIAARVSFS